MRLFILGKTSDDKGTQLEQLTVRILEKQGYRNIQTNIQNAGGNEIDVTAYKTIEAGIKPQTIKLIAECKAYDKPIDMNAWLKFKGKFDYEKEENPHATGMMICLSGANGPVLGLYNEKHNNDQTIQLIANGDLISLLSACYELIPEIKVRERLATLSFCEIYEINLLYYDKRLYWATSFLDGKYTLSYSNGQPITKEEFKAISPFIANYSPYIVDNYVDIRDYIDFQQRLTAINMVLLTVLVNGFSGSISEVSQHIQDKKKNDSIDIDVLEMAIEQNPFVIYDKGSNLVRLKDDKEFDIIDFYRFVIYHGCSVDLISSEYYQEHIDNKFLDNILQIQYRLEIPDDKRDDCLFLLKCSPSALLRAITPNKLFHGFTATRDFDKMRNLYINLFLRMLIEGFIENFYNPALSDMFFDKFKITDMNVSSEIKIVVDGNERSLISHSNKGLFKQKDTNQVIIIEKIEE